MLTFYHAPQSRSLRTLWLLEETGLDYEIRYVDIVYGDGHGRPDPTNPHPDAKVPAIVHDGVLVTESHAIAIYLTDLAPRTGLGAAPKSPARGPFLAWLLWAASEFEPALFARIGGADDPRSTRNFDDAMRRLETVLADEPYLMGDHFTAVDLMVASTLDWAKAVLPDSDILTAYIARAMDRPLAARAWAKDAPPAQAA